MASRISAAAGWLGGLEIEGGRQADECERLAAIGFGELAGRVNLAGGVRRVHRARMSAPSARKASKGCWGAGQRRRQRAGGEAVVEPVIEVGAEGYGVRAPAVKPRPGCAAFRS